MSLRDPAAILELIRSCVDSNRADDWQEFVAHFQRPISLSVIRTARRWGGLPYEIAPDLVQDTFLKLCDGKCRLLYQFALQNPDAVEGYVKTIAANVTRDYLKSQFAAKNGAGAILQAHETFESESESSAEGGVEAIERAVLIGEIEDCLDACTEGPTRERDRVLFWLYYRQGLSARAISELPEIAMSVKGVESAILRLSHLVRDRLKSSQTATSPVTSHDEKGLRPIKSFL